MLARRTFISALMTLTLGCMSLPSVAASYFENGQEVDNVVTPGRVQSEGLVEAVEFFWYGCPHCHEFEPRLEDWVAQLPKDVAFVRLPASWNEAMTEQQRLYFTLARLNRLDLHSEVFKAIHVKHKTLNTAASIENWAASQKFNRATWRKAYRSAQVAEQVKGAQNAFLRFELSGVPQIVINGKYVISNTPNVLIRADEMVQKELKALQPPASP